MSLLKAAAKNVIGHLPFRRTLLNWGALLHPSLKTYSVSRAFSNLLELETGDGELTTNLGITPDFRVSLDYKAGGVLLFGKPKLNSSERGALVLAQKLASESSAFVDIGANRGYFTFLIWASTHGRIPIYFFEPTPKLFERLVRNVRANRMDGAKGFQKAIAARPDRALFFLDQTDDATSTLIKPASQARQMTELEVEKTSFDTVVREEGLDNLLVKVDIEGAEREFLSGVNQEARRIRYLIMEVLGPAMESGFVNEAREKLEMEAYLINHLELHHSPDGAMPRFSICDHSQYNWLFCRLPPPQLAEQLSGSGLTVRWQSPVTTGNSGIQHPVPNRASL